MVVLQNLKKSVKSYDSQSLVGKNLDLERHLWHWTFHPMGISSNPVTPRVECYNKLLLLIVPNFQDLVWENNNDIWLMSGMAPLPGFQSQFESGIAYYSWWSLFLEKNHALDIWVDWFQGTKWDMFAMSAKYSPLAICFCSVPKRGWGVRA